MPHSAASGASNAFEMEGLRHVIAEAWRSALYHGEPFYLCRGSLVRCGDHHSLNVCKDCYVIDTRTGLTVDEHVKIYNTGSS